MDVSVLSFLSLTSMVSWVSAWVGVVRRSICGSNWFMGINVVCGYRLGLWVSVWLCVGFSTVVLWFVGISMGQFVWFLLSFAMVWFLIWSNCFVLFVCLFVCFFFFFCCCDLWLWQVGQRWRWLLLLCWFLWKMFIIILMSYLYYFKWVALNIESLMLGVL